MTGRTKWFVWCVLLAALLISAGCVFPPLGPQQTPTPPLILSPVAVTPATRPVIAIAPVAVGKGATIFVSGAGWQPKEVIAINLIARQANTIQTRTIMTVTADEQGQFGTSFVYPADGLLTGSAGTQVTALSVKTGKEAIAPFTLMVTPTLPVSPTLALTATTTATTTINLPVVISAPTATATSPATPTPTPRPTITPSRTQPPTPTPTNLAHVTSSALNMRSGPALTYAVLRTLNRGVALTILGQNPSGDWLYVLLDDGTEGWLARAFTDYGNAAPVVRTPQPPLATPTFTPVLTPTPTPVVITNWRGEYYDNASLTGAPRLVRDDSAIDFAWGNGAPSAELPDNAFSVRWTRNLYFAAGRYRFHLQVDDGMRLFVDNALVLDEWRNGSVREVTTDLSLSQGAHNLRVEYYEDTGEARAQVWWESVNATPTSFPDWKGEYWSNRNLAGDPTLVRNDTDIDFNWGDGAPAAGLPSDDFSARWTRRVNFKAGLYRFSARADDGLRFYLDDERLLDEWHTSGGDGVYTVEIEVEGRHQLRVEYYERSGGARVEFGWQHRSITPTPTVQFTPTWTPLPPPTPTAPTPTFTPTWTATPTSTSTPTPTATPVTTATAVPFVNITPATGSAATEVTVSGGGFPAMTTVNLHLAMLVQASQVGPTSKVYATTQTDNNGDYRMSITMPDQWPDGTPITVDELLMVVATTDFSRQASASFHYLPPTAAPTATATEEPTAAPTIPVPTDTATVTPTETPTVLPSDTATMTPMPTDTPIDTSTPTVLPTDTATVTPMPTDTPTALPTDTVTAPPTDTPTLLPTDTATAMPTDTPTLAPTDTPTPIPTDTPMPIDTPMPTATQVLSPYALVAPSAGGWQTSVTVRGGGFPAHTTVMVYLGRLTSDGTIEHNWPYAAETKTNGDGDYRVAFALPKQWPDGAPIESGNIQMFVATQDFSLQTTVPFAYDSSAPAGPAPDPAPQ